MIGECRADGADTENRRILLGKKVPDLIQYLRDCAIFYVGLLWRHLTIPQTFRCSSIDGSTLCSVAVGPTDFDQGTVPEGQ